MAKITEAGLFATLQRLHTARPVRIDETVTAPARLALERMLHVCR